MIFWRRRGVAGTRTGHADSVLRSNQRHASEYAALTMLNVTLAQLQTHIKTLQ